MEENDKDKLELQKLGLDNPIPVTDENQHRNDGKWCKAFREAQRPEIKQLEIGLELNGITQQAVSKIESRKILPDHVLEVYARLCHVRVDMIKNMPDIAIGGNAFNDRAAQLNDRSHQVNDHAVNAEEVEVQNITVNPLGEYVQACKDKDDLHREIIDTKNEQIEELKKMQEDSRAYTKEILGILNEFRKG